jgi:hypothetical protein
VYNNDYGRPVSLGDSLFSNVAGGISPWFRFKKVVMVSFLINKK